MLEEVTDDIIMIQNQTNYTKEEATEYLNKLKDPILVIKQYLNNNTLNNNTLNNNTLNNVNTVNNNSSVNQQIYKEIREKLYYSKRVS